MSRSGEAEGSEPGCGCQRGVAEDAVCHRHAPGLWSWRDADLTDLAAILAARLKGGWRCCVESLDGLGESENLAVHEAHVELVEVEQLRPPRLAQVQVEYRRRGPHQRDRASGRCPEGCGIAAGWRVAAEVDQVAGQAAGRRLAGVGVVVGQRNRTRPADGRGDAHPEGEVAG